MSRPARNPTSWDEYQYGTSHRGSMSSGDGRSVQFEDSDHETRASVSSTNPNHPDVERQDSDTLRRRRSSVALRLNALAQVGGVNSIANFARSWQRAAGFHEVAPRRPSFVLTSDDDTEDDDANAERYARANLENARLERTSLLRQHLEAFPSNEGAVEDEEDPDHTITNPQPLDPSEANPPHLVTDPKTPGLPQDNAVDKPLFSSEIGGGRRKDSVFTAVPYLVADLAGSYGTSYGTLRSGYRESSMAHAGQIWRQQQEIIPQPDEEREPLIVKEVEQDGKIVLAVAGQSTLPQTVFNATNVLIGVGLLSLPLALKYSGMICGMAFLFFASIVTAYTANLLAKCLDLDVSLITFADLAFISYGPKARLVTGILFMLELLAACVALVVLFADTLHLLIPEIRVTQWKIICGILLIPLNFVPLRYLSFTSVLGIFSCFCSEFSWITMLSLTSLAPLTTPILVVLIVFVDGFIKLHSPGSLREPSQIYLFPENWLTLPLSFGILMSPFGGHSVFPSIYRDMRHPQKYAKGVKITFSFTYLLDAATAVAGILMFGDSVKDEITANILETSGYPKALSLLLSIFIAIIPLTKLPLNARPIVSTIEVLTGLDARAISNNSSMAGLSSWTLGILKVTVRIISIIMFVIIAIIFPAFDSIMAFMGSALCFTICVILPLLFHVKLFGKKIGRLERIMNYVLIVICSILAVIGTVFAFLPKSMIGAE